ncbi:MAG: lactate utilization protein [Desulfovibrio sp.]|jgi:hypothetical protein|nr:lactate utilization protein [Desulfovibrio sp.]
MNEVRQWHNDMLGRRAVDALNKNNFTAVYFPGRESAVAHILGLTPDGSAVGIGGSMTERALDLSRKLADKGCTILDHGIGGLSAEERTVIRRKQLLSDVFLCSSNAVTLEGELINCDGNGNRVAAMIFGPKRVIVVAGTNKIVRNRQEGEQRIKLVAAPMNNKRLGFDNPCVQRGECADCRRDTRICNATVILSRRLGLTDLHVVIIGEELGF